MNPAYLRRTISNCGAKSTARCFSSGASKQKILNLETLNPKVLQAEYAVRGELVLRAEQHVKTLKEQQATGKRLLPFDDIVYCNIGNPQSLKQKPLTYFRQYVSLMEYPELLNSPHVKSIFPQDVIARAQKNLTLMPGMGAYSHSMGLPHVRKAVSEFIERRDGYSADSESIFMYNGASPAVQNALRLMIKNQHDGILIPIPQYPLYSASIKLLGGSQVGYYLNEEKNWGLEISELSRSVQEAKKNGVDCKALVIINPGNPTGQVLSEDNMREVIDFCNHHRLVLMADEVYQENVYIKDQRPFNSFKKVLRSMGPKYNDFEMFSFHSISKGFMGECGQRGGYAEVVGMDEEVKAQLYKLASILLCPNTAGQLLMEVMVNPPKQGEESYSLYAQERDAIYSSLKRRAEKLTSFLDTLEGVSCNPAEGAMYAFPQIRLPPKAIHEAEINGKRADDFYAISLLDATGVCVVPGSGFGQRDNTFHFRTTFLPPENQMDSVMKKLGDFHKQFMAKYK